MKRRWLSFLNLPAMFLFVTPAQAGPNSDAHIAIHLTQPVGKNACNMGTALPTCRGINTTGQLYPPTA